jgi:uncharacterized protein (TIGR02145 family)
MKIFDSKNNFLVYIVPLVIMILVCSCQHDEDDVITDTDGNFYTKVSIGIQTWMVENLQTTRYNDGTVIPNVTDPEAWKVLTTPVYCWYNNDSIMYKATYGALYNWYTVSTSRLCPKGWHVPTKAEWDTLTTYVGGNGDAGRELKEAGTTHWADPNFDVLNETGFTALPGGNRYTDGQFINIRYWGTWWSSSEDITGFAISLSMAFGFNIAFHNANNKVNGFSVR